MVIFDALGPTPGGAPSIFLGGRLTDEGWRQRKHYRTYPLGKRGKQAIPRVRAAETSPLLRRKRRTRSAAKQGVHTTTHQSCLPTGKLHKANTVTNEQFQTSLVVRRSRDNTKYHDFDNCLRVANGIAQSTT